MNLQRFYQDPHTKRDVEDYMIACLEKLTLEKAYQGDCYPTQDVKSFIDFVFNQLEIDFGSDPKPLTSNQAK